MENFPKIKIYSNTQSTWAFIFKKELLINSLPNPSPLKWPAAFLYSMKFNAEEGIIFSKKCKAMTLKLLEESLSSVEELILEGDVETTKFQIERLEDITPEEDEDGNVEAKIPYYERQKGVLHYAVLCRNEKMVNMLLTQGCDKKEIINRNDYITGFTPLHLALFVQSFEIMWALIKNGANPYVNDNYGANVFDYARMLGILPQLFERTKKTETLSVYDLEKDSLEAWPISKFEETMNVTWMPYFHIDRHYLFELMYSGFAVGEKDMKFREKYGKIIYKSSGDSQLILAKISDTVGFGVYAGKSFQVGDFIVRYGGHIQKEENVSSHAYCMTSGVEGVILNSEKMRNMGGMVNHVKGDAANAEAKCIFDKGVEQAIIVATKYIPRGYQILIDYSDSYFGIGQVCKEYTDFSTMDGFPRFIPSLVPLVSEEVLNVEVEEINEKEIVEESKEILQENTEKVTEMVEEIELDLEEVKI
jgi:hypothetical protein